MIYYPIASALASGLFVEEDIIVSTESEAVRAIAEQYGASVPFLRDERLAHDPYGILDVVLDFLEKTSYRHYDAVCVLLPTAPLTAVEDVLAAHRLYAEGTYHSVMTVTRTEHNSLRSVFVREGKVVPLYDQFIFKKSQELEATYRLNGAVAFLNIPQLLRERYYFLRPWGAVEMPASRSVDIDDEEGYLFAKFLKEQLNKT